eukprot:14748299-Ditylum_brightwellii.AAC.1
MSCLHNDGVSSSALRLMFMKSAYSNGPCGSKSKETGKGAKREKDEFGPSQYVELNKLHRIMS